MNDYLYVGYINTFHGINGKVKVISETNLKEKVFKVGNTLYLGKSRKAYTISSYQETNKFIILGFKDYDDINLINDILKQNIYVKLSDLNLASNEFLYAELVGAKVREDGVILGEVTDIVLGKVYDYLKVKDEKEFLIPIIPEYIVAFNRESREIVTRNARNLIV